MELHLEFMCNWDMCWFDVINVVYANMSVISVLDMEKIASLLGVVGAAKENYSVVISMAFRKNEGSEVLTIDFLKRYALGLRNHEPYKDGQKYVRRHEKEE